ncbi:auxilin-like clathrin-binding protein required for normal clathrin function [Lecanora helva]
MNDLSSVEWTAPKPTSSNSQQYPQASGNYYPALRPTPPLSGRSTPSVLQQQQRPPQNIPTRSGSSTPAGDTFANLLSFNASQSSKGASLQEQQRKLQEEREKREAEKQKAFDSQFGSSQGITAFTNGSSSTPDGITSPPGYSATSEYGGQKLSKIINKPFAGIPNGPSSNHATSRKPAEDEHDLLAAFDASAPVDRSSHMADVSRSTSGSDSNQGDRKAVNGISAPQRDGSTKNGGYTEELDEDPFGLGTIAKTTSSADVPATNIAPVDDDDVLGLLGRPVSEFSQRPELQSSISEPVQETHPQEQAVAELVDMGFPPEKAKKALETTHSGTDVQSAVGWLLNQAHEETRKETRPSRLETGHGGPAKNSQSRRAPGRRTSSGSQPAKPAWMREQGRLEVTQSRASSKSPVGGEKDPTQYASELGNKMFKTAGSLWKTGTKKFNQAVQDFNSDSDSSQPKWMRDAQPDSTNRKSKPQARESDVQDHDRMEKKSQKQPALSADSNVTDEALMLEADSRPPPRKTRATPSSDHLAERSNHQREGPALIRSKPNEEPLPQPKFMQQVPAREAKAKLSRQAVEEESSQAYISPARRRRPTPKPAVVEPKPDLLFESSKQPSKPMPTRPTPSPHPRATSNASLPSRPAPPERKIPALSSFALQASTKGRQEGNAAFKRGDYAQATTYYSSSLTALPSTHPLAIVVLTNRALSHSKTGDSKASMADAKSALELIGPSKGTGETIDLGGDEGSKQMSTYWEKAMMRHAEALEHLERWSDAAATWRLCVEAGVGGATSSAGRIRCEKAAAPVSQHKSSSAPKKAVAKPRPKSTALGDLAPDSESVTRLRAANAAADRLDDEKFALADVVDQRVSRWRAGKEGNLRALLSTLETVLWDDSGWKKVGMGDVLLPGKVKLVYMKGIAKVHPDKLPTTATTEQTMISAAVFATLNEAWERFKTENGL